MGREIRRVPPNWQHENGGISEPVEDSGLIVMMRARRHVGPDKAEGGQSND